MPPVFGVLFDGLAYGMLLFLLSVGLSVTLGMMNFVNLAHCSFAMLGGYVTVTLMNVLGWPVSGDLAGRFRGGGRRYLCGCKRGGGCGGAGRKGKRWRTGRGRRGDLWQRGR